MTDPADELVFAHDERLAFLGLPSGTIAGMALNGKLPSVIDPAGRGRMFFVDDLKRWHKARCLRSELALESTAIACPEGKQL